MPAKSRRNRRNISQGQKTVLNQSVSSPVAVPRIETARTEKTPSSYNPPARATASTEVTYPYVLNEIKWIGVVTVIIAVILVILYIFFH
jgi:hypothetical protein